MSWANAHSQATSQVPRLNVSFGDRADRSEATNVACFARWPASMEADVSARISSCSGSPSGRSGRSQSPLGPGGVSFDPDSLLHALFPDGPGDDGINHARDHIELIGDARGFGTFSGDPFGLDVFDLDTLSATGNNQRADQIKPQVRITGDPQSYFDPLAYAPVTGARFGTSGYNSLRGPGTQNLDFSLYRTFRITERFNVQFRGEVFNLTNTPHFSNPGSNVSNLQLTPEGQVRNLGGFTQITTTSGIAFKIPGRVGDSPILGAGLYVDQNVGAAGSTGRGESNLYNCSSYLVIEEMRRGAHPKVKANDFLLFNQQLAALSRAGIPILQAISMLRKRAASTRLRAVLGDVEEQIRGGAAFDCDGSLSFPLSAP